MPTDVSEPEDLCRVCGGVGYVIGRRDELAHAEPCPQCQASCPICHGVRIVIGLEGGYEVARPCACVSLLERIRLYNESGIPGAYADKHLADFKDRGDHALARAHARMGRYRTSQDIMSERGIVLLGGPGLGKTHLVVGLLAHLTLQRAVACRFVDFYQLCARIRATFNERGNDRDDANERDIIADLVAVPVLVLDDLGKGQGSAWELTVVDQLVTRRYNAKRIILATTNFLPEAELEAREKREAERQRARRRPRAFEPSLEERIGARLLSRLHENCDFELLPEIDDYRLLLARRDEQARNQVRK